MNEKTSTIFSRDSGFNVSSRYVAINTANVVSQFEAAGFVLHRQSVARVKDQAKQGFQKHLLVFRHPAMELRGVTDSVPEIILKNSYDGSTSFQIFLGIYRMVCANGLMVGSTYETLRVRHVGANALQSAIDGAFQVSRQVETVAANIQLMQSVQLTQEQQLQFAGQAGELIRPDSAVRFDASLLLKARRGPDTGSDLWSVYNRVQENIIRGGLQYLSTDSNGRVKRNTKRGIKAIDANVAINRELWTIAEQFAVKG